MVVNVLSNLPLPAHVSAQANSRRGGVVAKALQEFENLSGIVQYVIPYALPGTVTMLRGCPWLSELQLGLPYLGRKMAAAHSRKLTTDSITLSLPRPLEPSFQDVRSIKAAIHVLWTTIVLVTQLQRRLPVAVSTTSHIVARGPR
jgi:hypothetical protein